MSNSIWILNSIRKYMVNKMDVNHKNRVKSHPPEFTEDIVMGSFTQKKPSIPISYYQHWYDIIIKDDVNQAKQILNNASKTERDTLLSSPFDFEGLLGFGKKETLVKRVNLPLHLAVSFCSRRIAELFLNSDVNVLDTSLDHADNVLHSCIITAFNKSDLEQDISDTLKWLLEKLSNDRISKLLFQENRDGFRPLEFAAQQGCLRIMKTLLESKGHKSKEVLLGLGIYRYHDVTEYETGDRQSKSPINMLAYLDKKKLQDPRTAELILSPLFSGWISAKIRSNMLPTLFWAMLRLTFFIVFLILDLDVGWLQQLHGNNSSKYLCEPLSHVNTGVEINIFLATFVIVYTAGTFVTYLIEIIRMYRHGLLQKRYDLNGRKVQIANTWFYRSIHAVLMLIILLTSVQYIDIIVSDFKINYYTFLLADIARSVIPVLSLWSICYFLQLIPAFGSSIISIQGMMVDMARFMIFFMIILLPFVHVFESFSLVNSISGCVEEFSSPYKTSYTLFRMMLNIYDPSVLEVKNTAVLYVLHAFYVFMVGVLLINFLIAMMSNSASKIAENEQVILKINQLAMAVSLEDRLYPNFSWLYKKLRRFGFVCDNGHIFIKSVGCRFSELYTEKQVLKEKTFNEESQQLSTQL